MVVAPAASREEDMAGAVNFRCVRNVACQLAHFSAQPAYYSGAHREAFYLWAVENKVGTAHWAGMNEAGRGGVGKGERGC